MLPNQLLFPPYAIVPLKKLRGPEWQALVECVVELPETHPDSLAFSLTMIRLCGCLRCETDSGKAMKGCVWCATRALRFTKKSDAELLDLYEAAQKDVAAYLEQPV